MKKILVIAIIALFTNIARSSAQSLGSDYQTAVGIKFGWWDGAALDVKHFIKDDAALEGQLSIWHYGAIFTLLYEYHGNVEGVSGLKWYVGGGGHIGGYNDKHYDGHSGAFIGIDGVLGLDYKFTGAPINLSLDIQPGISFPGGYNSWGGLGVRYTF